jgi:RHS repeat-associated protein
MFYDADSGLYPWAYRAYDPAAGRPPSPDALREEPYRAANLYADVGNPLSFGDPRGPSANSTTPVGNGTPNGASPAVPAMTRSETLSRPDLQSPGGGFTLARYVPGEGPNRGDRADMMVPTVPMTSGDDGSAQAQTPQARLRIDRSPGNVVVLPDGSNIPDLESVTGNLMSPVADLSAVAAAGRRVGSTYLSMLRSPESAAGAFPYLAMMLGVNLGHAGTFDYQRRGNMITGYTHLPQFAHVSNVNVGLFGQQAGLTLEELLTIAGKFACNFSGNSDPSKPYCLNSAQLKFITAGYKLGQSGVFDPPAAP